MSVIFEPDALAMNGGLPPTLPNDRTGEFTPPGICFCASRKAVMLLLKFILSCFFILFFESSQFRNVISNPGIPGEKSLYLKQIYPRILVEMKTKGKPSTNPELYLACDTK
jgi:hypothetical protein